MRVLGRSEYSNGNPMSLSGIEYHRQYMPFQYMAHTSQDISFNFAPNLVDHPEVDIKPFDLYHVVRKDVKVVDGKWTDATNIKIAKENGIPTVIDFDDLWRLDSTHALYNYYKEQNVSKLSIKWMESADHVTTTTERLATHIRKYNNNVTVLPNCINPIVEQFSWSETDKEQREVPNIGWVGSIHHFNDIALIRKFFEKYWAGTFHKMSNLVMGGFNSSQALSLDIARLMGGSSEYGLKNLQCVEAMPSTGYAMMYKHIDIALAPLADNEFNRCKSELKLIEAGHFGIPIIASDVYPYNTVIEHGVNGFLIKNSKDCYKSWLKYTMELVHDPVYRYHMGQELKKTINERFNIKDINAKRVDLYRGLCRK